MEKEKEKFNDYKKESSEKELWQQARKNAIAEHEEECGAGSWDELDKYTREDRVWFAYLKLMGHVNY